MQLRTLTWLGPIHGAGLADELVSVHIVQVHALAAHMLVRTTPHDLKGLLLRAGSVNDSVIHL